MPKGVDKDIKAVKRFLDAMQARKKKQKPQQQRRRERQAPATAPQQEDKFAQLVRQARERQAAAQQEEDFVKQNMLYSQTVGASPAPGVVPSALLGNYQPDPERGAPIGVDVSQMSEQDRNRVLSRVSVEDQEELARRWAVRMGQGGTE